MGRLPDTDLERFVEAQERHYENYERALAEIRNGRKVSHWIWYIFPQLRGLGRSPMSMRYGLEGLDEATRYLAHPILGPRLREITRALLEHRGCNVVEILGAVDALKVCSSMTLFDRVAPDDCFAEVLLHLYGNQRCRLTLARLGE